MTSELLRELCVQKSLNMMHIKNIIFDLGGVLLNLDFGKTSEAFSKLGIKSFDEYFSQYHSNPLFVQLETSKQLGDDFYNTLRASAGIAADNDTINAAWNAMLLDFPEERVVKLKQINSDYRIFLLSNTNSIHHAAFSRQFYEQFHFDFDSLFEKAYYSHLIGYRKPGLEAFQFVIDDAGVDPAETLFLDDTIPNVEAAKKVGMQTALVTKENNMLKLLNEFL